MQVYTYAIKRYRIADPDTETIITYHTSVKHARATLRRIHTHVRHALCCKTSGIRHGQFTCTYKDPDLDVRIHITTL